MHHKIWVWLFAVLQSHSKDILQGFIFSEQFQLSHRLRPVRAIRNRVTSLADGRGTIEANLDY
jgi:hypothetical protein